MLQEVGVFDRGLILGLIIAAPVGPVGLLCIRRTLQKGVAIGFATGLGAACADAIFGAIAVLGIGAIVDFIAHYSAAIRLCGGLVVLATAWHTWHDHPKPPDTRGLVEKMLGLAERRTPWASLRAYISGLGITITNPLTLFGTLAVVATFGAIDRRLDAEMMILGIFAGSVLWWFLLSGGVGFLRCHFTENRIVILNRFTAGALAVLACWALISGARAYIG